MGSIIKDLISGAQGADLVTVNNKTTVSVEYAQAFTNAGKTWTAADLASSRSVLTGVTSDPATVKAAEDKIKEIVPTPTLTPTPTPTPPTSTMTLNVTGDTVALTGTDGTITLMGADLVNYPASKFGTVNKALSAGIDLISATTAGTTLSAAGNSAATSFNFGTGAVGGTDTVNSKIKSFGFTTYVASNNGDTITMSADGQNVTGGNGADTINGVTGTHAVSGGGGVDTFNVTAGTFTISDLGNGGNDNLVVSAGATGNATLTAAWTATASSSNATGGTATVTTAGFNASVQNATGAGGWTLTNAGNATAVTLVGSANNDILTGGTNNDTLTGGAGNDTILGGNGADTFNVNSGTDTINDRREW